MGGKYKILVVDNEMHRLADIYSKLLLNEYNVEVTVDWDEVVGRVKKFKPDLILIKSELPKFDGPTLCRAIKTKFRIPVILLIDKNSAAALDIDGCDADAFIEKPVDGSQLLQMVEEFKVGGRKLNN